MQGRRAAVADESSSVHGVLWVAVVCLPFRTPHLTGGLMALVKLIDEAEATGKVKAIFDDIKATKGIERVPNIWRALANHPDHLEVTWQKLKTIMRPGKL